MPTERCPQDDGDCSYPDRVLIVSQDGLSVVTAAAAEEMSTVDEPDEREPLRLLARISYEELVDLALESTYDDGPGDSDGDGAVGMAVAARRVPPVVSTLVSQAAANRETYLIVNCAPCGHKFKKRVNP